MLRERESLGERDRRLLLDRLLLDDRDRDRFFDFLERDRLRLRDLDRDFERFLDDLNNRIEFWDNSSS